MKEQAITKIRAEMEQNKNSSYVQRVGGFILRHLENCPASAEKIMQDGKTVKKSLDAMRTEASKHKDGNVGVLTDEEGFEIVLKYFGIKAAPAKAEKDPFDIDLDDLLED